MKIHAKLFACILSLVILGVSCKKSEEAREVTPAKPATSEPVPAPPPAQPAPAATAPPAGVPADSATTTEAAAKMSAADWAMRQDEIKNDPNGQWAISATASSSYGDAKEMQSYSPNQAVGAPNVDRYGDNGSAWTSKTADAGIEWLDLKFPKPVHASEVRIRESCGSGAVIKVELFDEQNAAHSIWAGNDTTKDLNYFVVKVPKTAYKTARVKITLATNVVPGWNEIDAVQLIGTDQ